MPCLRSHDNQISELGPSSSCGLFFSFPSPKTARMGGAWEAHHPQADTPPPLRPTRVCKYLFFYHVRIFFSSLLTMQKWSLKHIQSPILGETGPKEPQPRGKGGPLPCPALPIASTAPRETPALSPLPSAIIWGPQPHPGAAASSCASIYYGTM